MVGGKVNRELHAKQGKSVNAARWQESWDMAEESQEVNFSC